MIRAGALNDPEGWDGVGGARESQDVHPWEDTCTPIADSVNVWQKPPQYCEVISLQ